MKYDGLHLDELHSATACRKTWRTVPPTNRSRNVAKFTPPLNTRRPGAFFLLAWYPRSIIVLAEIFQR